MSRDLRTSISFRSYTANTVTIRPSGWTHMTMPRLGFATAVFFSGRNVFLHEHVDAGHMTAREGIHM